VRPLIACYKGRPLLTQEHIQDLALGLKDFTDFLRDGIIEYLDVNEENNAYIALNEDSVSRATTHMEIEPFTILGVIAGLIPYPHHN
jgi:DNA-directed RNA polymerase III subunit RPC2